MLISRPIEYGCQSSRKWLKSWNVFQCVLLIYMHDDCGPIYDWRERSMCPLRHPRRRNKFQKSICPNKVVMKYINMYSRHARSASPLPYSPAETAVARLPAEEKKYFICYAFFVIYVRQRRNSFHSEKNWTKFNGFVGVRSHTQRMRIIDSRICMLKLLMIVIRIII